MALSGYLDELLSVHEREFTEFVSPEDWSPAIRTQFAKQVEKELLKIEPFWRRSKRRAIRAAVPHEVENRLAEMLRAARALQANEPRAVLGSLEQAYADNLTPAIPIKCEGTDVTVALVMHDADALLGDRKPGVTKAGNPSLAVWAKRNRNDFYWHVILSDVAATAKEGFANAPGIQKMNIVVVRRLANDGEAFSFEAILMIEIPRVAITGVEWAKTTPSRALGELPAIFESNEKTLELTPLGRGLHPEIDLAFNVVSGVPSRPDFAG